MRILVGTESYFPNIDGGAVSERALVQALAKRGHSIAVCAPSLRGLISYRERDGKATVSRLPSVRLPPNPAYHVTLFIPTSLALAVRRFRPHIVHVHNPFAIGFSLSRTARRLGIPLVGSNHLMPEHFMRPRSMPSAIQRIVRHVGWGLIASFYRNCDVVVSPTRAASILLERRIGRTKGAVISNGVDLRAFRPGANCAALRRILGIRDGTRVMLFTGRLAAEKRIDVLIQAFTRVARKSKISLIVAGEGPELQSLAGYVRRSGLGSFVFFPGFVPRRDLRSLYCLAEAFIMPSTAELQSVSCLEAMACGIPVIGSNSGALPELIRHGRSGMLFPADCPSKLAECMARLAADPGLCRRLGRNARRTVARHSICRTAALFERLYRSLAKPL